MFGLFQRPKLEAKFTASQAVSDEFARQVTLAGSLTLANQGADADLSGIEMLIIAGFRRISLEVPGEWQNFHLAKGASKTGDVGWSKTLDSPLRAQAGELFVSAQDQKRQTWQWRLPFQFELR